MPGDDYYDRSYCDPPSTLLLEVPSQSRDLGGLLSQIGERATITRGIALQFHDAIRLPSGHNEHHTTRKNR